MFLENLEDFTWILCSFFRNQKLHYLRHDCILNKIYIWSVIIWPNLLTVLEPTLNYLKICQGNLRVCRVNLWAFSFFCIAYETERLPILSFNSFIESSHFGRFCDFKKTDCLFVCLQQMRYLLQYHCRLQTRKLGQAPITVVPNS